MNSKELNNTFFELENKYDLFNKKINGIYFWEIIRFELNRKLLVDKWVITEPHKKIWNKLLYIIKNIFSFLYKWIFKNPFLGKSNSIFIFWHPRRKNINGIDYDIYTDFLKKELQKNNIKYQDFETFYEATYSSKSKFSDNILSLDFIDWLALLFGKKIVFSKTEKEILLFIEKEILNKFNVKINILNFVSEKLKLYNIFIKVFTKLIKWKTPTIIIEIVWYWLIYKALNSVAKDFNIKTIELQHWVINKYHLWYSMWNNKNIEWKYFPDYIFTWWEYWNNICNYAENIKLVEIWFPYFDINKNIEQKDKWKLTKNILVISQWHIWILLSKKIYNLAKKLPNYTFYYKLHAWEFHKVDKYFSFFKNIENIKIVKWEKTVYDLFSICSIQIWVCSTALYEWLWFWLKTIIFDLSCSEYLDTLINDWVVNKVLNEEQCKDYILNNNKLNNNKFNNNIFFKKDSLLNLTKNI